MLLGMAVASDDTVAREEAESVVAGAVESDTEVETRVLTVTVSVPDKLAVGLPSAAESAALVSTDALGTRSLMEETRDTAGSGDTVGSTVLGVSALWLPSAAVLLASSSVVEGVGRTD